MDTVDEQGNSSKVAYKSKNEEEEEAAFLPVIETSTFYVEDNFWEKVKAAFTVKISSENVNGMDCYKFHINDEFEVFANKKDFMKIKEIDSGTTTEVTDYKFNSVEESDVAMPSLEGYIIEN